MWKFHGFGLTVKREKVATYNNHVNFQNRKWQNAGGTDQAEMCQQNTSHDISHKQHNLIF